MRGPGFTIDTASPVRREHPLLRGCTLLFGWGPSLPLHGGLPMLLGPARPRIVHGSGQAVSQTTNGIQFANRSSYIVAAADTRWLFPSTTTATIVMGVTQSVQPTQHGCVFGGAENLGNLTTRLAAHLTNDGQFYWDFGNASANRATGPWITDGKPHIWVFTTGPRFNMRVYRDGEVVAQTSGSNTRAQNLDNQGWWINYGFTGSDPYAGYTNTRYDLVATYGRELSSQEVAQWSEQYRSGLSGILRSQSRPVAGFASAINAANATRSPFPYLLP